MFSERFRFTVYYEREHLLNDATLYCILLLGSVGNSPVDLI